MLYRGKRPVRSVDWNLRKARAMSVMHVGECTLISNDMFVLHQVCFLSNVAPQKQFPRRRVEFHTCTQRRPERTLVCRADRADPSVSPAACWESAMSNLRKLEELSRPGSVNSSNRYEDLPAKAKVPGQMLGTLSPGCEGTHGVFPKCNFACTPCYHSEHANAVRVDGMHTVVNVADQMQFLRKQRGPVGHCQLIGGEVSLLSPEDHAAALEVMRFYGRIPMSFTHGDFDYEYLRRLALRPDGSKRFERIDFAVHFDMYMTGRRTTDGTGLVRARSEMDLSPYRKAFVNMFKRLKREHNVNYYLAHNMTVQEGNLMQVADVVRDVRNIGFRMMSFQPAARQGDQRRWRSDFQSVARNDGQDVWEQIQKGANAKLSYKLFQMGDLRCNRTAICGLVGPKDDPDCRVVPFFDDDCPRDARVRDIVCQQFGNLVLTPRLLRLKVLRFAISRFWLVPVFIAWSIRFSRRAGGLHRILRYGVRMITFVMHRFMDASDVKQAWELMDDGITADDPRASNSGPRIKETMERLAACSYGMAQVKQGRVVPACVQHSVYDSDENMALAQELKLGEPARPASVSQLEHKFHNE